MQQAEQQDRLNEVLGGKYQVLCLIGGGGMAQVFLARHRLHGGLVAVKVLVDHLARDPRIVARFEQEARMAATLASHPNIVPIFDIGQGNGLHYMIMQYIAGEDLSSYLRREGRLKLPDAANAVAQATEALSCAEAKRIVHRDLKLANMLLDEAGRVKLLDFGISRVADLSDGLTRPGESMGTPYYMSPEQIRGEACDIRSDLYSLGAVFFELISGRHPFENESVTAIQIAHLSSPPPSLLTFVPELPTACDAIVQKLLSKRPEDRYQSTAELLEDLTNYGATAGPGNLRPIIAPPLREAVERAETLPLDSTISTASAPVPVVLPVAPVTPASMTPVIDQPPPASTTAAFTSEPPPRSSRTLMVVALAAFVLLALGAAGFFLLRGKGSPAPDRNDNHAAVSPALPQTSSDAHGRMVLVPAGQFLFGDKTENKTMNLPAFYIDETEVSNAEYQRFSQATGREAPKTQDYTTHPDYPVSGVSYQDAAAYAAWAGKRLPTEEEWEKAARGTDGRNFPWGDNAWTTGVPNKLQPVNSQPSRLSPYGAYNMAGNVWEWTTTPYAPQPEELAAMKRLLNGQPFSSTWQIIKGGSFAPNGSDNFAISKRRGLPSDGRSPFIGLRCVRDANPPS